MDVFGRLGLKAKLNSLKGHGMSEKVVTTADVIAEVRKIAREDPDFVYGDGSNTCSYFGPSLGVTNGSPCIIGKALHNLEVDTSILFKREAVSYSDRIGFVLKEGFVPVVSKVNSERIWLNRVQNQQDFGKSWSEAVVLADQEVELNV